MAYQPFPSDETGTANITALDAIVAAPTGNGALLTGASTAGSIAAIAITDNQCSWVIQISGTWTGTLYFECSMDSTNGTDGNWITTNGRQAGFTANDTNLASSATANGLYRGNLSGYNYLRVRSKGASHTGTATVLFGISSAVGPVFLNASIPAGTDIIGKITPYYTTRVVRNFILDTFTAAPVTEALQSVVQFYNAAAVAATTTPAVVPVGKILRLTSWWIETKSLTTVGSALVRVRANASGVVALGSPLVTSFSAGSVAGATTTAMTGAFCGMSGDFGAEGIEFAAGTGVGFSMAGYGPTGALTLEGVTRFGVHGYEYTAI